MSALVGYRGRDAHRRAMHRSATATTDPSATQLADGSWVGCGSLLLGRDGTMDQGLYGARGSYMLLSEAVAAGLLPEVTS